MERDGVKTGGMEEAAASATCGRMRGNIKMGGKGKL